MSGGRFLACSATFITLVDEAGAILLHRRANTGFMDGWYDMPAGHVEQGEPLLEAAIRELHEETGVKVVASDLDLWHINQFSANNEEYYNFFFKATKWEGEPKIMEPDKADDMQFFAIDALPKMTAGTHVAMKHFHDKPVSFDYIDQAVYDEVSAVA